MNLLSKLNHEYPILDTPSPGFWKMKKNGIEEDLNEWNPHQLDSDKPLLIISNVEKSLVPIEFIRPTQDGRPWAWAHEMRSFQLPSHVVFELQGDSHMLLVLRCQIKVKLSKKQRKIHETSHSILVPAEYGVAEVLALVRASAVSGVFEEPNPNDLRKDNRSARELGWKHGTTLRLEMW
ncbi:MAG: hypothetical protein M1819_005448 [Sarea resinae]|nr:MAG: hypothetical protein M1819_005448 [Sarea resinae]